MREKNEEHYRQNKDLVGRLRVVEVKIGELSKGVAAEKEGKVAMNIEMKKMIGEHRVTINRIAQKHKATTMSSKQKQKRP